MNELFGASGALPRVTGVEGQLVFIALYGLAAGTGLLGALLALVRRHRASGLVRLMAALTALLSLAGVFVAAAVVPNIPEVATGANALVAVLLSAAALALTCLVLSVTVAEPRTAALISVTGALSGCGLLLYLLLYASAPDREAAAEWELRRLAVYAGFVGIEATIFGALGSVVTLRHRFVARVLHSVAVAGGIAAVAIAVDMSGGEALKPLLVVIALASPALFWLAWLRLRARSRIILHPGDAPGVDASPLDRAAWSVLAARSGIRGGLSRFVGRLSRLPRGWLFPLAAAATPVSLAVIAIFFGSGDTAREAARVDLGGLAFTPALLVPFAFAPALGFLLGSPALRARGLIALGLTLVIVGLLVAQHEVGYTGVVLAVAAAAFLTARGTLIHLLIAGAIGAVALGLAFELQPVLPWIPFTVRERVLLWLGGAGFVQRGGHLLIADRVTYDVGGFWGLGFDQGPGFQLQGTVNAVDTDFPLSVLGLHGGFPWLVIYIALFVAFAVLLYDIARREGRTGSLTTSRWRMPALIGLATVLIASTVINISGGLTHLTPFAGVPAVFLSYGSFFLGGTVAIVAFFLVAGNDDAVASLLKERADKPAAADEEVHIYARDVEPISWWRNRSWSGVRLWWRRVMGRLRLATADAGALLLVVGLVGLGVLWGGALYTRYTDRPHAHAHPALLQTVRVQPGDPGTWKVPYGPETPAGWAGDLASDQTYRLDALELRYSDGYLRVVGACFPGLQAQTDGVRVGFDGLMAPRLGAFASASADVARTFGAHLPGGNDLVLPMAEVWMRHVTVNRVTPGRLRISSASPGGRFQIYDEAGEPQGEPMQGAIEVPSGWQVALGQNRRLRFRLDDVPGPGLMEGEVCLRSADRAMFTWQLSRWRDTLIGPPTILRRAPLERSVDFAFAERIKHAVEGVVFGARQDGTLWVIDWSPKARAQWDPSTRQRFRRVFRIKRRRGEPDEAGHSDPGQSDQGPSDPGHGEPGHSDLVEELHWVRQFYSDRSSRVRIGEPLEALAPGWDGALVGLANPFRFSRQLPVSHPRDRKRILGQLLDARGRTLAAYDDEYDMWRSAIPNAGALVGYGYPRRGIYGGLIRVFRRLLNGRPVRVQGPDAELGEKVLEREAGFVGVDVMTTIDARLQERVDEIVAKEGRRLWREALELGDSEWFPRARALVMGPQNQVLAAVSYPRFDGNSLRKVLAVTERQRDRPRTAPGLDALHHGTTVGSTAKIGLLVAAARHAPDHFLEVQGDDLCIRAEDDVVNAHRDCFIDRGLLKTFRGETIHPIQNFGRRRFGKIITLRELIVRSVNTASAYLSGRLGLAGIRGFYEEIRLTENYDLLPRALGKDPELSVDIERFRNDPLSGFRARLGELPPGDTWRTTYDVRLALSGFSDLTLLHLVAATAIVARDGRHYWPAMVRGARDLRDGRTWTADPPPPLQVIPVRVARYLKGAMQEQIRRGSGYRLRRLPRPMWTQMGGKTGTAETVKLQPGSDEDSRKRGKLRTQDHKFYTGFWPADSRTPFVVAVGFEHVSHLDTQVAVVTFGKVMEALAERLREEGELR